MFLNFIKKGVILMNSKEDIKILRELGKKMALIASYGIHKEKEVVWKNVNDLKQERPVVWINEIPWHEMNYNDELTLKNN